MSRSLTSNCPHCNRSLQIADDVDCFVCKYCGNKLIVRRNADTVFLSPAIESVKQAQQIVDRVAIDVQVKRLQRERMELAEYIKAKQESFDYWYTSESGLLGLIRGIVSSKKQADRKELDRLYRLAQEKREEQERLTELLSS